MAKSCTRNALRLKFSTWQPTREHHMLQRHRNENPIFIPVTPCFYRRRGVTVSFHCQHYCLYTKKDNSWATTLLQLQSVRTRRLFASWHSLSLPSCSSASSLLALLSCSQQLRDETVDDLIRVTPKNSVFLPLTCSGSDPANKPAVVGSSLVKTGGSPPPKARRNSVKMVGTTLSHPTSKYREVRYRILNSPVL